MGHEFLDRVVIIVKVAMVVQNITIHSANFSGDSALSKVAFPRLILRSQVAMKKGSEPKDKGHCGMTIQSE